MLSNAHMRKNICYSTRAVLMSKGQSRYCKYRQSRPVKLQWLQPQKYHISEFVAINSMQTVFFYCLCVFLVTQNVKLHLEVLCQPIRRSQEKYKNSASVLTYRLVCTGQCVLLKWLQLGTLKEEGNR